MTLFLRVCVGCDRPFQPGRRDLFLCPDCKREIREEAEKIRKQEADQ
ncbi:hypothetical protein [Kosakonia phage Kc166B]|nr:hypothetical protein [Kosakonia phage Kc166B]